LHHFHILSVIFEDARVGTAEGVPANAFGDTKSLGDGLDVMAHHLAKPEGLFAALCPSPIAVGREDPIARGPERSLLAPLKQIGGGVFVNGNRLLGYLGLASPNVLVHKGTIYIELEVEEVDILPLQTWQLAAPQPCYHIEKEEKSGT
jgi:hypothetical protein